MIKLTVSYSLKTATFFKLGLEHGQKQSVELPE